MYNLYVVQITDLNLNVQTKQEKKKSEQKLNLQAMNKPVLYGSLYFKLTNFAWFTCTNPCRIFEQKVQYIVQNLLIDRPVSQLTKRYSG